VFLHLGTGTALIGFCCEDPLKLRCASVVSSCTGIYFNLSRKPVPIKAPVYWSCLFITANLFNIGKLLYERSQVVLSESDEALYAKHFMPAGMRPRQFKKLLDAGKWTSYDANHHLTVYGEPQPKVFLLLKGTLHVSIRNERVNTITEANPQQCFIGEISLLESAEAANSHTSQTELQPIPSSATVVVAPESSAECLEWDKTFLVTALKEKSEFAARLRSVFLQSMLKRLQRGNVDADESHRQTYAILLRACVAEGTVGPAQKRAIEQYASLQGIDPAWHADCLRTLDWTPQEWENGVRVPSNHTLDEEFMRQPSPFGRLYGLATGVSRATSQAANDVFTRIKKLF
jgi:CRP-like cAMP-binding protein